MSNKSDVQKKILSFAPCAVIVLYAAVTALALFMNGDDYIWYYVGRDADFNEYTAPNGRYFSNFVTTLIVRYPVFRYIFIPVTIVAFLYVLAKLLNIDKKVSEVRLCFALSFLILIPASTYAETILWMSGFTNYVFSVVLTLIFILTLFNVLFRGREFKLYHFLLFPVLAVVAGLCVEHIAIYDVFLGIAAIILLRIKRKKFYVAPFFYLIPACISIALMFTNRNYSNIAESGDDVGIRTFYFSFSDLFYNIEQFVVPNYIKRFFAVNLVIAVSFLILYRFNTKRFKASKYAPLCMTIVILYAAYSVFYSCYTDLVALKPDMKIRGFEVAFTFLYIVSLLYMLWVFFDGSRLIRFYFYICSTILLTAPFSFINPVTARCFFENYVFWILFSGELLFTAVSLIGSDSSDFIRSCFIFVASALTVFVLGACISNKYYNDLRFDYIREQAEDPSIDRIQIIDLPYQKYVHDDLSDTSATDEDTSIYSYYWLMCRYYGIDGNDKKFTHISTSDYYVYNNE